MAIQAILTNGKSSQKKGQKCLHLGATSTIMNEDGTRAENNNPKQLKISRLPRYDTQLDERSLPTLQKTERRAALHQRKI